MSKLHVATAAVVKVSIGSPSGNSVASFVRRGEIVPEGVDKAQLTRLVKQGFIAELDEPEPDPEPVAFSADDVAAAVKAAEDAKDDELAEGRRVVEEEARAVAQAKTDLETARAAFETAQAEAKKSTPAPKAPAAK
ncbi:hypothetical protein [Microbacterium sp. cx-59]|uniref:hypothetical protein n=1 Tax=Microbacterium sp. cx-59 TaxID=2891207 RepID=UPI001E2C146F|nr:hypothetical protein [Microbacterium sp. cx-59]MCC4906967.1 hypothetical protein [Microbacterium sp. cx-59]